MELIGGKVLGQEKAFSSCTAAYIPTSAFCQGGNPLANQLRTQILNLQETIFDPFAQVAARRQAQGISRQQFRFGRQYHDAFIRLGQNARIDRQQLLQVLNQFGFIHTAAYQIAEWNNLIGLIFRK